MELTGTNRLVCSQKVSLFFSYVLIRFLLATWKKVKLAQRKAMSWDPDAKIVIHVFTLRWGWRKNVIKAIVAVLCGGAFALAKPCNYERYPLWPALLSVPAPKIGFVPHAPARRKIISDPNCCHLYSLLRAILFPLIYPIPLKAHHLCSDPANTVITSNDRPAYGDWVIPSALNYLFAPLLTVPVERDIIAVVR